MTPADEGSLRKVLGGEVRRLRLARGFTLREAAPRCGLSYQMLGQIEKDGQNTTLEKLEGIIRGLRATVHLSLDEPSEASALLAAEPEPPPFVGGRGAIAERFLRVLPHIPDEEVDVFLHELALWERRYRPTKEE